MGTVPFVKQDPFLIMTDFNIVSEEFTPAEDVITCLSQLKRDQFLELISSDHPDAKKYRRYAKKEFEYRNKSYQALNSFFNS